MVSLSTCTTVPSMWSQHVSFLQTYKGCRHALRMFIINQTFLQFLPDPWISLVSILTMAQPLLPNTGYTQKKKKRRIPVSPSSSEALFPWPEWPTSTPALTLMALAQLSPCFMVLGSTRTTVVLSVAKNGWTKLFWQELSCWNSGKEEKFHKHNPIHVLQTGLFIAAHSQAQTKNQSAHFPGTASCLHLSSGGKTIVFEMYLVHWNVGHSSCHDSCTKYNYVLPSPVKVAFSPVVAFFFLRLSLYSTPG